MINPDEFILQLAEVGIKEGAIIIGNVNKTKVTIQSPIIFGEDPDGIKLYYCKTSNGANYFCIADQDQNIFVRLISKPR